MRSFNTSGPNILTRHYTLERQELILKGLDLALNNRYFTIWAPRQTGKSTYFGLLKNALQKEGYQVVTINLEDMKEASFSTVWEAFRIEFEAAGIQLPPTASSWGDFSNFIRTLPIAKLVFIVDEVEGLNPDLLGQFLHAIRNLYHSREVHCLKSVILVGVSNITGVVGDNASPFNIADSLSVPYFTSEEVSELLAQHTTETGQRFEQRVTDKIFEITAGQPGLVNGFANQLVTRWEQEAEINYDHYLEVEHWYSNVAIDKNFANILNKAKEYQPFLETLLFTEAEIPFRIDRPAIKALHINGLIRESARRTVEFWVPLYRKRLHNAFYPYINGEKEALSAALIAREFFTPEGNLDIPKLMGYYKAYALRRGFNVFREKDENGKFISEVKESALIYSFETFLSAFVSVSRGQSYREADTGPGKSDLVLNIRGQEILFETKKYYSNVKFEDGLHQLSQYARSLGLNKAVYVVFTPDHIRYPEEVKEDTFTKNGVDIEAYLIPYNEEKDFGPAAIKRRKKAK